MKKTSKSLKMVKTPTAAAATITPPTAVSTHICFVCRGNSFEHLSALPVQEYDGQEIHRDRVRCQDCGQISIAVVRN